MDLAWIMILSILPSKQIGFLAHLYGKGNISYAKSIAVWYALLFEI